MLTLDGQRVKLLGYQALPNVRNSDLADLEIDLQDGGGSKSFASISSASFSSGNDDVISVSNGLRVTSSRLPVNLKR